MSIITVQALQLLW